MLKSIKNLASLPNDPKISIQSKGIVNTGSNWAFYASDDSQNVGKKYYSVDSDKVLFIKISFSGLTTNDRIAQTLLSLIALSVPCNLTVKLYSTSFASYMLEWDLHNLAASVLFAAGVALLVPSSLVQDSWVSPWIWGKFGQAIRVDLEPGEDWWKHLWEAVFG